MPKSITPTRKAVLDLARDWCELARLTEQATRNQSPVMKAKRGDLVVITRPKGEDMDLTLTNDFHNTEVTIRAKSLPWRVTPSQQRRIDRALCGMSDCKCGTIRGPQYHEGRRLWLDWSYGQQGEAVLVVDYEECEPKPAASRS